MLLLTGCTPSGTRARGGPEPQRQEWQDDFLVLSSIVVNELVPAQGPARALLVDLESFEAAGLLFLGERVDRSIIAPALGREFRDVPLRVLRQSSGSSPDPLDGAVHVRLQAMLWIGTSAEATAVLQTLRRWESGQTSGDFAIVRMTFTKQRGRWVLHQRSTLLSS